MLFAGGVLLCTCGFCPASYIYIPNQGQFNILVATCIAEEGLDIGQVDLIVSFDASTSPIRNIQRAGRTGRKRSGRVVLLVAEGCLPSPQLTPLPSPPIPTLTLVFRSNLTTSLWPS